MNTFKKIFNGFALSLGILASASAQNLVSNGDFSSTTSPGSSLPLSTADCSAGRYKITNNFQAMCSSWPTRYDHTLGTSSGGMLLIDDTYNVPNGNTIAWSQSVNVVSGVTYNFSFWANALYSSTTYPVNILMKAGSTSLSVTAAVSTASWTKYKTTYTASSTGAITLSLVVTTSNNINDMFLDFGIDDIVFTPCEAVTNGDFSNTSGAVNSSLTQTTVQNCTAGQYMIGSKFLDKCWSWPTIYDHTSGNSSGKFLIIDNGSYVSETIWSQNVTVVAGVTYTYTIWVNPLYSQVSHPMTIYMNVNGSAVRSVNPSSYQTWSNYDCSYTATSSGIITLSLTIAGTSDIYRDFGIDDISFNACYGQAARPENVTGVDDLEDNHEAFSVYPNPSNGFFTVNTGNNDAKEIYVYDAVGKLVYSQNNTTERLLEIDLTKYPKGLFVLKVISNSGVQVQKVISE